MVPLGASTPPHGPCGCFYPTPWSIWLLLPLPLVPSGASARLVGCSYPSPPLLLQTEPRLPPDLAAATLAAARAQGRPTPAEGDGGGGRDIDIPAVLLDDNTILFYFSKDGVINLVSGTFRDGVIYFEDGNKLIKV